MLHQIAPYFGYIASALLVIALLVGNDLKFRWFNTMGNIFFITYAIIIHAFPVLVTNLVLLSINLFYLIRIYRKNEVFDLLEFKGEEKLMQRFLDFYREDIRLYFPAFTAEEMKDRLNFVVIRDLVIANVFSAKLSPEGDAEVLINYTVKKYRDFKVGRFIFEKERDYLVAKGVKRIIYTQPPYKKHEEFLKVMGFVEQDHEGKRCFVKVL